MLMFTTKQPGSQDKKNPHCDVKIDLPHVMDKSTTLRLT